MNGSEDIGYSQQSRDSVSLLGGHKMQPKAAFRGWKNFENALAGVRELELSDEYREGGMLHESLSFHSAVRRFAA